MGAAGPSCSPSENYQRSEAIGTVRGLRIAKARLQRLRAAADAARKLHYAPYSGQPGRLVLAAAELSSGTVRGGSNVEIATLSLTKHAEEVAILAAFADADQPVDRVELAAVYVAGSQPSGSCRQFAAEFASGKAIWVIDHVEQETLRAVPLVNLPDGPRPLVVAFDKWLPSPFSINESQR
jgi:cytidine deaminase